MRSTIKFKPRKGIYANHNNNLTFNPATGLGVSYKWYEISKRIDGVLTLNVHPYSVTTVAHVAALRRLFAELRLEYAVIEAPGGLQRMDIAYSVEQGNANREEARRESAKACRARAKVRRQEAELRDSHAA